LNTDQVEKIVPPKKGQKHVMRVVREILGATPEHTGTQLSIGLQTLTRVARRRSVAFLISDFYDNGWLHSKISKPARVYSSTPRAPRCVRTIPQP